MNIFLFSAVFTGVLTVIFFIFNKIRKSVLLGNICFICFVVAFLFTGCLVLEVDKLFEKEITTQYRPVTTSHQSREESKGRPVKNRTEEKPASTTAEVTPSSDTVYITKSGSRYHLSYTCGGNEYYECTLEQALERGLTPCKKCAQ